jgi:signal transduction histidine kinase
MTAVGSRRAAILALAALTIAAGATALIVARARADLSPAAHSGFAQVAFLLAGGLVAAAGLARMTESERPPATLLVAAGCAWFIAELDSPAAEPAALFTIGLAAASAAPAVLVHAAVALARPPHWRAVAIAAYVVAAGVLGVLSAALFDPVAQGCTDCPANLLRVATDPALHVDVQRVGVRLACVVYAGTALLLVWSLITASVARRRMLAPVLVPVSGYLAFAAATYSRAWERGFISHDPVDRALWLGQAAWLAAIAAGVAWERLNARSRRSALARLVVDLASSPRPGGLSGLLAISLGDPGLQLVYPAAGGGWIDSAGRPARTPPQGDPEATALTRDRAITAVVLHRPGLLDDPRLVHEIQRAARLAIDHERLQADLGAQLSRLRESRARIVGAGDAERRRLERNLHDGAQQGLLRLAMATGAATGSAADAAPALCRARDEIRAALDELRMLAHGVFPAVLEDQGLAAAIVSLAEWNAAVSVGALPERTCAAQTELAAYFCVAGIAQAGGHLDISGTVEDGWLVLALRADDVSPETATDVEDRVGAADGRLHVNRDADGATRLRLELPCG